MKHIVVKSKKKEPEIFHFEPIEKKFTAKYPLSIELRKNISIKSREIKIKMKGTQIPLVSNDACTVWKLQGASVDNIYAVEWYPACKNWVYVILSRVKKKNGLYLRSPINTNVSAYRLNKNWFQ